MSKHKPYCMMHYYRIRRNGQLDLPTKDIPELTDHSGGYRLKYHPNHPLSRNHSRVYEHRFVYHAEHGDGPFKCYHCADVVTWDDMHVDHLNDQPDDNRIENLAASCPECNMKRGAWKVKTTHRQKSVRQITWQGVTRCASEWAELLGLRAASFQWRLKHWPLERVMTEPRGSTGPHRRDILAT
ncbi:MAG: HNH endonuclease [Xanthomonadales bacterium]|nr:HNH endonuclease [Xanthomonadales bacterium]